MPQRPHCPTLAHLVAPWLLVALLSGCASTDRLTPTSSDRLADCADVTQLQAAHLYGTWDIRLPQRGESGQLTLRQHPEFKDSLRGEFRYGGQRSIASGDVEGGEFNLDESRDGKTLFAFWSGKLTPSRCGAEIRGTWQILPKDGQPAQELDFVLERPGTRGNGN